MKSNRKKTLTGYKIKTETKIIYQSIIQGGAKQHKIAREIQWKNHLPNINFEKIWKNTYKSYGQAFTKDSHYRLLHHSTKTNMYMHKCSRDNNPSCDYCGYTQECTRIKNIWKHYQTILTKLTGQNYTQQQYLFTPNIPDINKITTKLIIQ